MNDGKSYAFFNWAAQHAWVPPHLSDHTIPYSFSYTHQTSPPPPLAPHDPHHNHPSNWVRPDFIVKGDDDTFVVLAELEARLRIELYHARIEKPKMDPLIYWGYLVKNKFMAGELYGLSWSIVDWLSQEPTLSSLALGAEDKQVRSLLDLIAGDLV